MKGSVWFKRLGLVIFALWIGAWQEHIKIDINYITEQGAKIPNFDSYDTATKMDLLRKSHAYMPYDYFFSHTPIEALVSLTLGQLAKLKWVVTILSILIFFLINNFLVKSFDRSGLFRKPLWISYLGLTCFSFAFFVLGRSLGFQKEAYSVSREIIGGLQSMVPVMIVFPIHLFISKQQSSHDTN